MAVGMTTFLKDLEQSLLETEKVQIVPTENGERLVPNLGQYVRRYLASPA